MFYDFQKLLSESSGRDPLTTVFYGSHHPYKLVLQREYDLQLLRRLRVLLYNLKHPLAKQFLDATHAILQCALVHVPRVITDRTLATDEMLPGETKAIDESVGVRVTVELDQIGGRASATKAHELVEGGTCDQRI